MRIIAGEAKGRTLVSPKGTLTRPLTGRAKEALFSSLGSAVEGARVLDLFAGSGSIGLEALSRGAETVVFVERDPAALAALERNVDAVGLGGEVVVGDVERIGERIRRHHTSFDLVFVDPPYAMPADDVVDILSSVESLVAPTARIIVHRRSGDSLPDTIGSLKGVARRRYGDVELWSFEAEEEVPQ